jgi:hypothetical protein
MRQRNRALLLLLLSGVLIAPAAAQAPAPSSWDPLTGPRSRLARDWVGTRPVPADTEILVMPGHADSQGVAGPGTSGEAVARRGARPMQPGISDELHWNLLTAQAIVRLGQERGLRIRYYDPEVRTIANGDDPRTTWSVGRQHAAAGGYALEIHYDAYGPDGVGSGMIVPLNRAPSRIDESLAQEFGSYPFSFRGGLGGPRRGVAILEIGKLEGTLERSLRDPARSALVLNAIADRVVSALIRGLEQPPGLAASSTAAGPTSVSPTTTASTLTTTAP